MIRVTIPSYRKVEDVHDSYTVFNLEVYCMGRINNLEKRYSEFEELHKKLKKSMRTPEFPPKKVMKWNQKVLEQRRAGLQTYMQGLCQTDNAPKTLLHFLNITLQDGLSIESLSQEEEQSLSHQPVLGFPADAFLQDNNKVTGSLHDIVVEGVYQGLYCTHMDDFISSHLS